MWQVWRETLDGVFVKSYGKTYRSQEAAEAKAREVADIHIGFAVCCGPVKRGK